MHNRDLSRRHVVLGLGSLAAAVPLVGANAAPGTDDSGRLTDVWMNVELVGADGRPLGVAEVAAPVLVVHLWASWCPACLGELASLEDVAGRLGPAGVETLLVSHPKHWEADQAFLKRNRVRLPAYTLAPETSYEVRAAAFNVVGGSYAVPRTLVFAGRERRCVLAREGAQDWRSAQTADSLRAWVRAASA